MQSNDHTSKLIKLRSLAFGNQIVLQLAVPTLFILHSDLNNYGIWLAINSYSGLITFFDLGLFAVIPTSAVVQSSRDLSSDDRLHLIAMREYSIRISFFGIFSLLAILLIGQILDVNILQSDFFFYAILSAINVLLILLLRYFEASFRSVNSPYGFAILTFHATTTTAATVLILYFRGPILHILILNLLISVIFLVQYLIKGDAFDSNRNSSPRLFQSLQKFIKQGLAYQMFPIGYLMMNQGIIIIIQQVGNFEAIGILGAIRAVAGVFRQISSIFINSSIPQMAIFLKAKNLDEARFRFRYIKKVIYFINSFILLVLTSGLIAYLLQGNSSVNKIPILLSLFFIISAAFDVPWNVWLIVPLSVNSHNNLGLLFLFSSFLTLILTIPAYKYLGLAGIALILLIQDLIMTGQTIRQGKQILDLA